MFARVLSRCSKTSTHDLPPLARWVARSVSSRDGASTAAVRIIPRAYSPRIVQLRRSYATAAAAAETEPTATVKKVVKAAVAKKPAAKKTAKKTTTAAKPRAKAATKTTAARKTTMKKTNVKKTAAKKPAKKKVAKKAAPKPKRVKKVLTAEEKETLLLRELKKKALKAPVTSKAASTWAIFLGEIQHASAGKEGRSTTEITKEAAAKYKDLSPAEKEHYNHIANEAAEVKKKQFMDWVHSHTPDEIRIANNARIQLRRQFKDRVSPRGLRKIEDDRAPKRPALAYATFFGDRSVSPDFKTIKVSDRAKLIAQEWKALNAGEKKKYQDQASVDSEAYKRKLKNVMGHE